MTLEEYLGENFDKGIATHTLTVRGFGEAGAIHFYIHPANANGDTPDFLVSGNELAGSNPSGEIVCDYFSAGEDMGEAPIPDSLLKGSVGAFYGDFDESDLVDDDETEIRVSDDFESREYFDDEELDEEENPF